MDTLYCYKNSNVLKNKYNLQDNELLEKLESQKCGNRIMSLMLKKEQFKKINNPLKLIKNIHHYIFSDVYEWAGEFRRIDIIKSEKILSGGTVKYSNFKNIESDFNSVIEAFDELLIESNPQIICDFVSGIWQIHPFREGNTRTCLLFSWIYLSNKGIDFNFQLLKANPGYVRNSLVMYVYGVEDYLLNIVSDALKYSSYDYHIEFKNIKEEYEISKKDYEEFKEKYSIKSSHEER